MIKMNGAMNDSKGNEVLYLNMPFDEMCLYVEEKFGIPNTVDIDIKNKTIVINVKRNTLLYNQANMMLSRKRRW